MTRKQRRAAKHAAGRGKAEPTLKRPGKFPAGDPLGRKGTMSRAEEQAFAEARSATSVARRIERAAEKAAAAPGAALGLLSDLRDLRGAERDAIRALRQDALPTTPRAHPRRG